MFKAFCNVGEVWKATSFKLIWILGHDQTKTFVKYHQGRIRLELDNMDKDVQTNLQISKR